MRDRFIISDTHFGHFNIIKYENRPFSSVDEMNESMIANWNKVVKSGDLVYHLGDMFMGINKNDAMNILGRLNGDIILVMGNHDTKPSGFGKSWFDKSGRFLMVSEYPIIVDDFYILSHEPKYISNESPYVNIYGHVHGDDRYKTICSNSSCVCVERTKYSPINFDELKTQIFKESIDG